MKYLLLMITYQHVVSTEVMPSYAACKTAKFALTMEYRDSMCVRLYDNEESHYAYKIPQS